MIYGMGTVFVFLTILVVATSLMSFCMTRFLPEQIQENRPVSVPSSPAKAPVDAQTLKVIQQAIYQHRAKTK